MDENFFENKLSIFFEKLKHRYLKYPDNNFNFSCLKNINIFYCYIDNKYLYFTQKNIENIVTTNDKKINKNDINLFKSKFKLKNNDNNFSYLLEGNLENNNFYVYDILLLNEEEINLSYKARYFLLKKTITEIFHENNFFRLL